MNNDIKKLSRKRKRGIERKIKMDDKMKSLLNKIKSEKENKYNDKIKNLEVELVKINYADNPNKSQSEFKKLNKFQVVNKNLQGNKIEKLVD